MADNNKYLDIVKNTAGSNWKPVNDAMTALRLTQMIIKGEAAYVRISIEDWFALGQPPAQRDGNRYIIDTTNPKIIALMWGKSLLDVMNLGCYAATDISDAINQINNDNLDKILTDREAMIAVSQIVIEGISAFKRMQATVQSTIDGMK